MPSKERRRSRKRDEELVKQDKSGRWDYTSATGTIHLEHQLTGIGHNGVLATPPGAEKASNDLSSNPESRRPSKRES